MARRVQDFCTARQAEILHRTRAQTGAEFLPMSRPLTPAEHKKMVAQNLRQIIDVIGVPQVEIGKRIGASKSRLGNWLRGDNYPDAHAMWLLCYHYGVTMDWIYRGQAYGLPAVLVDGLRAESSA